MSVKASYIKTWCTLAYSCIDCLFFMQLSSYNIRPCWPSEIPAQHSSSNSETALSRCWSVQVMEGERGIENILHLRAAVCTPTVWWQTALVYYYCNRSGSYKRKGKKTTKNPGHLQVRRKVYSTHENNNRPTDRYSWGAILYTARKNVLKSHTNVC